MTESHDPLADLPADDYALTFAPVALARTRHDGLTAHRQRLFILQLRVTGVVTAAARAVGVSAQAAYKLRARPDAASFAAAWDRALTEGRTFAYERVMDLALNGRRKPICYRGREIASTIVYDDHLLIAALRYPMRALPPAAGDNFADSTATLST